MEPESSLPQSQVPAICPHPQPAQCRLHQSISPCPRLTLRPYRNTIRFTVRSFLAPRPNPPKLEYDLLSAVNDWFFFNIFAATLHIGGRSSMRNLRTRHAVVQGPTYYGSLFTRYIKELHENCVAPNLSHGNRWRSHLSFLCCHLLSVVLTSTRDYNDDNLQTVASINTLQST